MPILYPPLVTGLSQACVSFVTALTPDPSPTALSGERGFFRSQSKGWERGEDRAYTRKVCLRGLIYNTIKVCTTLLYNQIVDSSPDEDKPCIHRKY
jgi:hypothetical protein